MKKPRVTVAQWEHARAAGEGAPMTRTRIAGMLGVHASSVDARAAQEGWRRLDLRRQDVVGCYRQAVELAAMHSGPDLPADWTPAWLKELTPQDEAAGRTETGGASEDASAVEPSQPPDPLEMLARASSFVARQLDRIIAAADRRGGRLDKAQIDGLAALARVAERWEAVAAEQARERQRADDDERAGTLREVVDRLVKHSEAEAQRLVEAFLAAQPDGGAGWRVAAGREA